MIEIKFKKRKYDYVGEVTYDTTINNKEFAVHFVKHSMPDDTILEYVLKDRLFNEIKVVL